MSTVLARVCQFDKSEKDRLASFFETNHEDRLVESQKQELQNELKQLLEQVASASKSAIALINDLVKEEPSQARNGLIRKACTNYYDYHLGDLSDSKGTLTKHLKEAGFKELAEVAEKGGRYHPDYA